MTIGCTMLLFILLIVGGTGVSSAKVAGVPRCERALGLQSGRIADAQLSASSSFDQSSTGPQFARLHKDVSGGAWCPQRQIDKLASEWIQVEFAQATFISAVETQGRYGGGLGVEYAPAYTLQYYSGAAEKWLTYETRNGTQLAGNADPATVVRHSLASPILADRIRLYPHSEYLRTVCMRIELYGCTLHKDSAEFTYSTSPPSGAHVDWPFVRLRDAGDGIGLLHDSVLGSAHDLHTDKWLAWSGKDDKVVTINISFASAQNVSSVHVYCAQQPAANVKVFKRAILRFGIDHFHQRFQTKVIDFTYDDEEKEAPARWIRIPAGYRPAASLQLQLTFQSDLMMISEIRVHSEPTSSEFIPDYLSVAAEAASLLPLKLANASADMRLDKAVLDGQLANSVTLYTVEQMPSHFVTTVIGFTVLLLVISALIILVVYHRARRMSKAAEATAAAYASAYAGALAASASSSAPANTYHSTNDRHGIKLQQHESTTTTTSSYLIQLDNQKNQALLDSRHQRQHALPPISPPPNRPCPKSPPPAYKSPPITSDEDSSEYADADFPETCDSASALLPSRFRYAQNSKHHYMPLSSVGSTTSTDSTANVSTFKPVPVDQSASVASSVPFNSKRCSSIASCSNDYGLLEIDPSELQVLEKIGEGQFGEVHMCSWRNKLVACKILGSAKPETGTMKRTNQSNDVWRECVALAKLNHVNIIRVIGVCSKRWAIIQEYAKHGDLRHHLRNSNNMPSSFQLYSQAADIAAGMAYLVAQQYIHRDLATRNCLVADDGRIKIADFGMARSLYSADYYKLEGSFILPIRWMATESLLQGKFTHASDVWAFGVTLWEIMSLCAEQPFGRLTDEQVITNIQQGYHTSKLPVQLACPAGCPSDVYDLMCDCWQISEVLRPNFAQIHRFLLNKSNLLRATPTPSSYI